MKTRNPAPTLDPPPAPANAEVPPADRRVPPSDLPPQGFTGVAPRRRTPPAAHLLGSPPDRRYFRPTSVPLDTWDRRPIPPRRAARTPQRALAGGLAALGLLLGLAGLLGGRDARPPAPLPAPARPAAIRAGQEAPDAPTPRPTLPRASAPAPATLPLVPAAQSVRTYTVRAGDWLAVIAQEHGLSLADLLAANVERVLDPERIPPGLVLTLPAPGTISDAARAAAIARLDRPVAPASRGGGVAALSDPAPLPPAPLPAPQPTAAAANGITLITWGPHGPVAVPVDLSTVPLPEGAP